MQNTHPIVYQVRAISPKGQVRIVHAYQTEEEATTAILHMRSKRDVRYIIIPVINDPSQYWGINFPE